LDTGLQPADAERSAWSAGVLRLGQNLGRDGAEPAAVAEMLRQDLEEARLAARKHVELGRQRDLAVTAERASTRELDQARTEHGALLSRYGVVDRTALEGLYQRSQRRAALEAERLQATTTIEELIPDSQRRSAVIDSLPDLDLAAAEGERDRLDDSLAQLDRERSDVLVQIGTLGETIGRLERESDTSVLRQDLEDARGALQAAAQEWLERRIARELLRGTRRYYEAQHRPAVLERAETLFLAWTDPEYSGFDLLSGSGLAAVIAREDGVRVALEGLSRGTAEQLYLAMRLALVEHLGTQQESMPIVMDDVLVNFDPERAKAVANLLCRFAREHQVLLFTCHPSTAEMFREQDSTCGVFAMERYGAGGTWIN
jgi:uncharacterized protein YhaN